LTRARGPTGGGVARRGVCLVGGSRGCRGVRLGGGSRRPLEALQRLQEWCFGARCPTGCGVARGFLGCALRRRDLDRVELPLHTDGALHRGAVHLCEVTAGVKV